MENKIYPAFYADTDKAKYMHSDADNYYCLSRGLWDKTSDEDDHVNDKNITTEYLANTYGEVKSKEHAEFIKLLAENNGIPCNHKTIDMNFKVFHVINGCLFFCVKEVDIVGSYKKITIPLPPECEVEDEWPEVGDTISLRYRFDSKQVMYTGELLYLSGNHIIIKTESGNDCHCIRGEWDIEKPKTPEQELRDEIAEQLEFITDNQLSSDGSWLQKIADAIVKNKISGLEITKKPQ